MNFWHLTASARTQGSLFVKYRAREVTHKSIAQDRLLEKSEVERKWSHALHFIHPRVVSECTYAFLQTKISSICKSACSGRRYPSKKSSPLHLPVNVKTSYAIAKCRKINLPVSEKGFSYIGFLWRGKIHFTE